MSGAERIRNMLAGSVFVGWILSVCHLFSRAWHRSYLINRYLNRAEKKEDVCSRMSRGLTAAIQRLFHALRLDRAFHDSIFSRPVLWCAFTAMVAPLLPTMAVIPLAALVAATAIIRIGSKSGTNGAQKIRVPAVKAIVVYIFATAMGIIFSVKPLETLPGGAAYILFAFTAAAVAGSAETRRGVEMAFAAMCFGGILVALYGIAQYFLGGIITSSAWADTQMFADMTRIYSTLENPNMLAEYLLLIIPFVFAKAICASDDLRRLFWIAALGAMLLCILLTYARGAWLGLIAAMAIFLIMLDRRFILLGIVGIIALAFVLPKEIIDRFLSIGNIKDGSTSYRIFIWLATLTMIRDHWLTGIGPGVKAFQQVYPVYAYSAVVAPHAHNLFLQLWCDGGIFALGGFTATLGSLTRALAAGTKKEITGRKTANNSRVYRIAAISAIAGFTVQGLTDYSFYNYRVTLVFWCVIGLSCALASSEFDFDYDAD